MKLLCFKFQQNHTKNKEFDFLMGRARGPHLSISIIIGKRMKIFCLKFQQNRSINVKNLTFIEGRWGGAPGGVRGHLFINYSYKTVVLTQLESV